MKKIQIGLAMSGGVDSTSVALMLKKHYNVTGFFMQLAQPNLASQIDRVKKSAAKIDVPLHIVDLRDQFTTKVLKYFSKSYFAGLTPNPCIVCNREIKFGLFMDVIIAAGMDKVATGHYARVVEKNNSFHLLKGCDPRKDQSYFLARLSQKQLSRVLFPLGDKIKADIYDYVERAGFHEFRGEESQDVCFLENESVGDFLRTRFPHAVTPGPITTKDGKLLGNHKGLHHYTIGQRRGLGISDVSPYYVIALNVEDNSVIVGKNEDLQQDTIDVQNLHWISGHCPGLDRQYTVRIRYSHQGTPARLQKFRDDHYQLHFEAPQRAVTPGQFAVIYDDMEVLGSGIIC